MPSLRERNKQRTRQMISDIATRLFLERGFDAVTIAEIASAAGVAKMTVTNHFPRKEDLVLDIQDELIAGPATAVAGRAPGESALAALRRDFLAALDRRDPRIGFAGRDFVRMLLDSPALRTRLREIHEQREEALVAVLPEDDAFTARLAAAQLTTLLRVLFDEVLHRTLAGDHADTIADRLARSARHGFDLLEPAFGGYAVR